MKYIFTALLFSLSSIIQAKNVEWICLKEDGSEAFRIQADRVYNFHDGLAPVRVTTVINNKYVNQIGFVNKQGVMVIAPQYDKVKGKGFVNGVAWVKKKEAQHWTLINKSGKEISTKGYKKVAYIHEGNGDLLCVYQGDYLGFINKNTGQEVIPCKYIGATSFHQGLACVTVGDGEKGYGFINQIGEIAIPLQFKQAGISVFMENGWCRAGLNGKTVLIDKSGKVVFKTNKGNIQGMSNNWVRVFTENDRTGWGYLNLNEEWQIQPVYDDLESIHADGRIAAQKNGLWGIIDTNENVLLEFQFATLYFNPLEDGYIMGAFPTKENMSLMNTPKAYYTPDLKKVELTGIKYIYPAEGGLLMPFIDDNNRRGYLDRNFNVKISATYSKTKPFSEGLAWAR